MCTAPSGPEYGIIWPNGRSCLAVGYGNREDYEKINHKNCGKIIDLIRNKSEFANKQIPCPHCKKMIIFDGDGNQTL